MRSPRLLAIGGAHVDRRGRLAVPFIPGASNPGTMREDVGGGAFNALRNAVGRGLSGAMLSVRGGDAAGAAVARAIAEAAIADLSVTFLDRATPSYTALLDREGDVIAALADMGLYDLAFPKQMRRSSVREAVAAADAVLTDANLPAEALRRLAETAAGKPVYAVAISPAKAPRLLDVLPTLDCLFLNRREAAALTGASEDAPAGTLAAGLARLGLRSAMISGGALPAIGFEGPTVIKLTPPPPRRVADVTGAGDALAGAAIAALLCSRGFAEAIREGAAAALLALESSSAVPPDLSPAAFAPALALVPEPVRIEEAPR